MKINALKCLYCGDIVYSRANHDCHFCSCGKVMVDAGPGYGRVGGDLRKMKMVVIKVNASLADLEMDWRLATDKYGHIAGPNGLKKLLIISKEEEE